MAYQFCIDGRPASPLRKYWIDAAEDAVGQGYGHWVEVGYSIVLDDTQGASIEIDPLPLETYETNAPLYIAIFFLISVLAVTVGVFLLDIYSNF